MNSTVRVAFAFGAWPLLVVACTEYSSAGNSPDLGEDAGANGGVDASGDAPPGAPLPPGCDLAAAGGISLDCVDETFGVFARWDPANREGGDGSKARPYGSLSRAVAAISSDGSGRRAIFAAAGSYLESVRVDNGVSIFGGFDATFANAAPRSPRTQIVGESTFALQVVTSAEAMIFDDLELLGPSDSTPRPDPSSIAAFVVNAGTADRPVRFRRVSMQSGDAAQTIEHPIAAPTPTACVGESGGQGGMPGVADPTRGQPVNDGGGAAGANGGGSLSCGTAGGNGASRTGRGDPGSASTLYSIDATGVHGVLGTPGGTGRAGAGGGGGGGGTQSGTALPGGMGAAGGCGGAGGLSGAPGGHSAGLLAFLAHVELIDVTVRSQNAGVGGEGQVGAAGAPGHEADTPFPSCVARGGDGGAGATGGNGGGGVGGSSMCLLSKDALITTPSASGWCQVGAAGVGGAGAEGAPAGPPGSVYEHARLDNAGVLVAF